MKNEGYYIAKFTTQTYTLQEEITMEDGNVHAAGGPVYDAVYTTPVIKLGIKFLKTLM